jgi:signal transduction histidine kinase
VHAHWPIRTKLKIGLALSCLTVLALFVSAQYGLYSYRGLVRGLSARSAELPLASQVRQHVSDLRVTLCQAEERVDLPCDNHARELEYAAGALSAPTGAEEVAALLGEATGACPSWDTQMLRDQYHRQMDLLSEAIERYRRQLDLNRRASNRRLGDDRRERETLAKIDAVLGRLRGTAVEGSLESAWLLDELQIGTLRDEVEQLRGLVAELPSYLHERLQLLALDVRANYRTAIVSAWSAALAALVLLGVSTRLYYRWFAKPLQELSEGSKKVAGGDFEYRIHLDTEDEIGQLAGAMNAMTERFCVIRNDLDRQVRERTNQVVRSEQLASVGFLAAGVSHEINNPLASIALCSESLEGRLEGLLQKAGDSESEEVELARNYLQMIQREAFRCKQITDKLLDFARRGESQRHAVEVRELVEGVLEMVQHLGQYQDKRLQLLPGPPVIATLNAQEIKQVVLNLVTNALESVDVQGEVRVEVFRTPNTVRIIVRDDGCGMSEEVRKHLFEPFFTRRRTGQGIGLGLSITHRIVHEHGGDIEATSDGPGLGSQFVVELPIADDTEEENHRYHAA